MQTRVGGVDVARRHLQLAPDHGGAACERVGTEEQKRTYLPRFATGELRGGLALTEPDCGTDLQAIRTRAVREAATPTSSTAPRPGSPTASTARSSPLLVKTDPAAEPRHKGMSMLLAEKGPGFRVSRKLEKIGYKGIDSAELIFEDYRVPAVSADRRREGRGLQHGARRAGARPHQRGGARLRHRQGGARRVGALRAAAQDLRQADRRAPGDPAQARRDGDPHRGRDRADLQCGRRPTTRARAATWRPAWPSTSASEAAVENALEAMRIHGAYGYSKEFNIERYYRDAPLLVHRRRAPTSCSSIIIARQLVERNRILASEPLRASDSRSGRWRAIAGLALQ